MFQKYISLLKDERGITVTTEMLIMVAVSAVAGALVVNGLLPHLKDMHQRAETSIVEVTGSGY